LNLRVNTNRNFIKISGDNGNESDNDRVSSVNNCWRGEYDLKWLKMEAISSTSVWLEWDSKIRRLDEFNNPMGMLIPFKYVRTNQSNN